ncbi:LuxR C-terminal-related transcriptional regulator [Inquilinus sp. CAU 1745]|uniref:LuxR C-terminal-related transcriptional regulator n=1 Tax=Inquilinus sp. CAU 1745 TaxID=3140369 RepID=UPI00325AC02E
MARDRETGNLHPANVDGDTDAEKEIARLTGVIHDLWQILDQQGEMICRFRPDTTLTYVNQAYAAYYGKRPEEMVGMRFITMAPPARRTQVMAYLRTFTPEKPINTFELRTVKAGGSVRWTWWREYAHFAADGSIDHFHSIGRDVTEMRLMELALADARFRLRRKESRPPDPSDVPLSRRERQIADLIVVGHTNKQIAGELGLQVSSVKVYITSLFRKLEVRNRTQAATRLLEQDPADS